MLFPQKRFGKKRTVNMVGLDQEELHWAFKCSYYKLLDIGLWCRCLLSYFILGIEVISHIINIKRQIQRPPRNTDT